MTAPSSSTAARLVVSTTCPNCGAPLDFSEGTNALQCNHCRSNLLVTGRRQVLSYFVSPTLDARGAISAARLAEPQAGGPFGAARRFFVPAFRHRRMKSLVDLATSLSELDPKLELAAESTDEVRGCHFDEGDAAALALFVHAGSSGSYAAAEKARDDSIRVAAQSLIWIPFLRDAYSLRDPFHGSAIARNLMA